MEEVIAGLAGVTFTLERDIETQTGTGLLPFEGMNKSSSAVCNFYAKGLCDKGERCPFRHDRGEKKVVCKHWLRGLCTKGDRCRFLHQYDLTRMPECYFYSKFGKCSNKECHFLHTKTAFRTHDCPWYDQGFCRDGPLCKYRHVRRVMCINYLVGFCPVGPKCHYTHPKMSPLFNPTYPELSWPRGSAPPAPSQAPVPEAAPASPPSDDVPGAAGLLLPGARPGAGLVLHCGKDGPFCHELQWDGAA